MASLTANYTLPPVNSSNGESRNGQTLRAVEENLIRNDSGVHINLCESSF